MNLVYLVIAHRNPKQLERLILNLLDENAYVIINIDKKSKIEEFLFIQEIDHKRIIFVENRKNIIWGGVSQINATLEMIEIAIKLDIEFDYALFISGQDFPIMSKKDIYQFLSDNTGKNFIDHNKLPFYRWGFNGGIDRISYFWFVEQLGTKASKVLYYLQKLLKIKRNILHLGNLYGGSSWWILNKEALLYVKQNGYQGSKYNQRYQNTLCADEIYFQTLLLNSPLKNTMISDNLRYIDWDKGPEYPRLLDQSDFERIITSGKLFARKFDIKDPYIIEKIERNNLGKNAPNF